MNVILCFAGLNRTLQPHTAARPFPLQGLAGGTIIGHILHQVPSVVDRQLTLIVEQESDVLTELVRSLFPPQPLRMVVESEEQEPFAALHRHSYLLQDEATLLIMGNAIVEADYQALSSTGASVAYLRQGRADARAGAELGLAQASIFSPAEGANETWAGVCWFQSGAQLYKALEQMQAGGLWSIAGLIAAVQRLGLQTAGLEAYVSLDVRSPAALLRANARLLGLGYGSEDAIERSYTEDFTALPPVFIHETAVIESSVIGPFANIEAGAVVRSSIVRNTLVGPKAQVENLILDESILGAQAVVRGSSGMVRLGDGATGSYKVEAA